MTNKHRGAGSASSEERHLAAIGVDRHTSVCVDFLQVAAVTGLAKHYQRSPVKITKEMIEDYLLYLKNDKGRAHNSCASANAATAKDEVCILCSSHK